MADVEVVLAIASGADIPSASGYILIGRAVAGTDDNYEVIAKPQPVLISNPPASIDLEAGEIYSFQPLGGQQDYRIIPGSGPVNFDDLVVVGPPSPGPMPTPSEIADLVTSELIAADVVFNDDLEQKVADDVEGAGVLPDAIAGIFATDTTADRRLYVVPGITRPALNIYSTLAAAVTAAGSSSTHIQLAPGTHTLSSDISIPRSCSISGSGAASTKIYSATDYYIKITGSAGGWFPTIEDIALDGVGIIGGNTNTDYANGLTLRGLEIYNVAIGIIFRHNSWLTRVENCRIHDCTTGIKHDFTVVANNSGANMVYSNTVVFDCTGSGFWVDGYAIDGWHVSWVASNIEHCKTSFELTAVGTGVLDVAQQHFELNTDSYIKADSGFVLLSDVWMFGLASGSGTKVAMLDLSGTARVDIRSGRISYDANQFYKAVGTSSVTYDPTFVAINPTGPKVAGHTAGGTPGASGTTNGLKYRSGCRLDSEIVSTISVPRSPTTTNTLFALGPYNGDDFIFDFEVTFSVAEAGNSLVLSLNPGTGGGSLVLTVPSTATGASVRVVWAATRAVATAFFNSNEVARAATTGLTHAVSVARFLDTRMGGSGVNTGTVSYLRVATA